MYINIQNGEIGLDELRRWRQGGQADARQRQGRSLLAPARGRRGCDVPAAHAHHGHLLREGGATLYIYIYIYIYMIIYIIFFILFIFLLFLLFIFFIFIIHIHIYI